jgi:predicted TIM-barrel fold metal-dependent hydrolase
LWDAAEQTGLRICLHVGTGHFPIVERGAGGAIVNYVESVIPTQRALAYFVSAGILDRHPDLKLILVEGGVSWLPGMMDRLEEGYRQHARFVRPKLSLSPSELIRRQVHATFQHDRALLDTINTTGTDALLWGSDYPHLEGTWPHTRETLDDIFSGASSAVRKSITHDNFAKLFELPAGEETASVAGRER